MEGILDLLDESAPDAGVEDSLADVSADDEVRVVSEDDVSDEIINQYVNKQKKHP